MNFNWTYLLRLKLMLTWNQSRAVLLRKRCCIKYKELTQKVFETTLNSTANWCFHLSGFSVQLRVVDLFTKCMHQIQDRNTKYIKIMLTFNKNTFCWTTSESEDCQEIYGKILLQSHPWSKQALTLGWRHRRLGSEISSN